MPVPAEQVLEQLASSVVMMRAPAPVTLNKAGANYKSEVPHLEYSPRAAYAEWLGICEAILAAQGDAIVHFEAQDERFLDIEELWVSAEGQIYAADSQQPLGSVDEILTGRVFSANGPWVVVDGKRMRALMPNMLAHRVAEAPYYVELLQRVADGSGLELELIYNPHRWEGMADVVACQGHALLTYTVRGHYDAGISAKSLRSSREGARYASEFAGLRPEEAVFAELVYPHFHGDTVHFALRTSEGQVLMSYPDGLVEGFATVVSEALGEHRMANIARADAVEHYAANSRQIGSAVLVPESVSEAFVGQLKQYGLAVHRLALNELFGKAGGGPGCATLYLPKNLSIPADAPMRYSVQRKHAQARLSRLARTLSVDPAYFTKRQRG